MESNSWNNRKKLVSSMIRFNHVDIVGVQEALFMQLSDLTALLDGYSWFGAGRDDGLNKGEFSAVLFQKIDLMFLHNQHFGSLKLLILLHWVGMPHFLE